MKELHEARLDAYFESLGKTAIEQARTRLM